MQWMLGTCWKTRDSGIAIVLLYDLFDLLLSHSLTHCLAYLYCKPFRKEIIPSPEDRWYYLNL